LASGCYEKVVQGDESVYRFAGWVGIVVIAAGLVGIPAGWLLRRWSAKWGFVLMGMSPLLLILIAPAMYSDRVVVGPDGFHARYGIWFSPRVHDVRFDTLKEIRRVGVRNSKGRINYELHCVRKDGEVEAIAIGDLVVKAVPEILSRAKARHVPVIIEQAERDEP
jgi:hypothetical protein